MRSWSPTIQSLLNALQQESFCVTAAFATLGLYYTNWSGPLSLDGITYTPKVFIVEGLAENLYAEAPSATLKITSLDSSEQARFFADSFRGEIVTLRILILSAGVWTDTTFSMTLTCDADQADATEVTMRLASSDAVEGTDVPRRSTQETGCQHDYMRGGCPYRGVLPSCDHGLLTPNGCHGHFPDLDFETGREWNSASASAGHTKVVQPLPYGACYGGITHRLVTG